MKNNIDVKTTLLELRNKRNIKTSEVQNQDELENGIKVK